MSISIGLIKWPEDKISAVELYLNFLLKAYKSQNLNFRDGSNDPVKITEDYLEGKVTDIERKAALQFWWENIDNQNDRGFKDVNLLMSRLAICFLSINEENVDEINEHLSWFIEVLGFLGCNLLEVINLMSAHFNFKANGNEI